MLRVISVKTAVESHRCSVRLSSTGKGTTGDGTGTLLDRAITTQIGRIDAVIHPLTHYSVRILLTQYQISNTDNNDYQEASLMLTPFVSLTVT